MKRLLCLALVLFSTKDLNAQRPLDREMHNSQIDVRGYGARAIAAGSIPSTTASIESGSRTVTLASASTFQNGDGIDIVGAGAAHGMNAPGAPTVTPSIAEVYTNTGMVVDTTAGATTYYYQIVARDKSGGLTAASPVGKTATGNSLGVQMAPLSSCSRSNNTVTCITSSAHGLVVNAMVHISGTVDDAGNKADAQFGGWYQVASVPDNRHFTFNSGMDTRNGALTTSIGGTVAWWNCNHLTWTAVTGAWEYYIYGRKGSSLALLGVSWPQGRTQNLFWDDFGSPMMDGIKLPSFVPATPPEAATNDPLVTTIVSGAGTRTLTLENAASNSVTRTLATFDDAPAISAAARAAGASLLYFPGTGDQVRCYIVSSYLNLPSNLSVSQAGCLILNDTMQLGPGTKWYGDRTPQGRGAPAFSQRGNTGLVANRANPGVYNAGGAIYAKGIDFTGSSNGGINVFLDSTNGPTIEDSNFGSVGGNADYASIPLVMAGVLTNSVFPIFLRNVAFLVGPGQIENSSATPAFLCNYCGDLAYENFHFNRRGILYRLSQGGADIHIARGREQGGIMPFLGLTGVGGGLGAAVSLEGIELDTMANALYANLGGNTHDSVSIEGGGAPSSGFSLVTGKQIYSLSIRDNDSQVGQNTNCSRSVTGVALDGVFGTSGAVGDFSVSLFDRPIAVQRSYSIIAQGVAPGRPSCRVSSGGSMPIGRFVYRVVPVWQNGAEGEHSPASAPLTTSRGNQTVACRWTPVPGSPKGYDIYRGNNSVYMTKLTSSTPMTTSTSFVDSAASVFGTSIPNIPAGGPSVFNSSLIATPQLILGGDAAFSSSPRPPFVTFLPGALTSTWTASTLTLDKAITVTRMQVQVKTAPQYCRINAIIRLSDGTAEQDVTIRGSANDSGEIKKSYAAGASLTVSVHKAASGCGNSPADANVVVQYRMQ